MLPLPISRVAKSLASPLNRSIYSSGISVGNDIAHSVTGSGPFIQVPTIEPLGNPGGFVKVLLPQDSILNVQSTSVSFIKGDASKIMASVSLLCGDIWYQEIKSGTPCTLLLSNNELTSPNQTCVSVSKIQKWHIPNRKSLLAWTGIDLSITRHSSALFVEGNGFFIARGNGNIQKYSLEKGESLFVQSKALVATCALIEEGFHFEKYLNDKSGLVKSTFSFSPSISSAAAAITRLIPVKWRAFASRYYSRGVSASKSRWVKRIMALSGWKSRNESIYVRVSGPGLVLVQTRF